MTHVINRRLIRADFGNLALPKMKVRLVVRM